MRCLIGGALGGIFFCSLNLAFGLERTAEPTLRMREPFPMYETVDTYRGCDVVRYTDNQGFVHYFLDCHNS